MFKNNENAELKVKIITNALPVATIAKELDVAPMTVYRWLSGKYLTDTKLERLETVIDRLIGEA